MGDRKISQAVSRISSVGIGIGVAIAIDLGNGDGVRISG
jgi:hypothetical protein